MTDDGPIEPLVERVERPDGRYVLYFSWEAAAREARPEPEPAPPRDEASGTDE